MEIPKGHQAIMPYLIVKGAEKFKIFVEEVFDAKEMLCVPVPGRGIMHAEMQINGSIIMLADSTDQWKPQTASMYIYVENADEIYGKALNHGATSLMKPENKDYGRSCGIKDPFDNVWWITQQLN